MKRALVAAVGLGCVIGLTGCSNGSSDLSKKAEKALASDVQALRRAAAGTDVGAVRTAVRTLQQEVQSQLKKNHLSSDRANAIDNAATALLNDFRTAAAAQQTPIETPSSTPPSTTQTPPPTSEPPTSSAPSTTATKTVTPKRTITVPLGGSDDQSSTASDER